MNEKQKSFFEKMQLTKPKLWFRFINENRKIYNVLCKKCQKETVQRGGKIEFLMMCEDCKPKVKEKLKTMKKIIEEAGGKVE